MGKKRSRPLKLCRPSVIVPYHVYHFKDMFREFDFVCLKKREGYERLYMVMMLNYNTKSAVVYTKNDEYKCGDITAWGISVGDVRFVEKSAYTENAIKLAKLITL